MARSLWREMVYEELSNLTLEGDILDLGGSHKSIYHNFIKGDHTFSVANLDDGQDKEFTFDFEKPFPTQMESFDGIVCLNVLEHVFNYQNVLNESHRTLKKGGTMVLAVPFLIRYHPSPNDYWRYTEDTLNRIFENAGFSSVEIRPIGTGVFGVAYSIRHNFYHFSFVQNIGKVLAKISDTVLQKIKPNGTYSKRHYPLGYVVTATK